MRPIRRFSVIVSGLAGLACLGAIPAIALSSGATPGTVARAALSADTSAVPKVGNPNGHVTVPAAGRAVSTSHPNHVIGHGTPAGCTSAAVVKAVAEGGIITFDCGPKPVTITMTATDND